MNQPLLNDILVHLSVLAALGAEWEGRRGEVDGCVTVGVLARAAGLLGGAAGCGHMRPFVASHDGPHLSRSASGIIRGRGGHSNELQLK